MGKHRNPYLTVVTVWIVSSFGLALLISFPIFYVVLFFPILSLFLALSSCLLYKTFHKKLTNRDLVKDLLSEARLLALRTFDDFRIVSARVSSWWLRREAQVQEEMIQKRERKAKKKAKLKELKQKRRARPVEEDLLPGEHEAYYEEVLKDRPSAKKKSSKGFYGSVRTSFLGRFSLPFSSGRSPIDKNGGIQGLLLGAPRSLYLRLGKSKKEPRGR